MDKTELVKRLQDADAEFEGTSTFGRLLKALFTDTISYINSTPSRDEVLPDGWRIFQAGYGLGVVHRDGRAAGICDDEMGARFSVLRSFLNDLHLMQLGGGAAPAPAQEAPQPERPPMIDPDMRDMFATSALIGLLATGHTGVWRDLADAAYHIAGAMLDARQGEK